MLNLFKKGEERPRKLHIDVVALIARLEIALRILTNTKLFSRYRSIFKGKGLEFEDYRRYLPTDDANMIDWKASVRANELLVKEYKEERNLDVYILLDTSSSMIFGSTEKLKMEYAAEVVASLSYLIMRSGDKAGLIMFNDKIAEMVRTSSGTKHFYILLRSLVDYEHYGGGYDLGKAIDFFMKIIRERGLLVIVSDFIGLREGWEDMVKSARAMCDVVGIMVRDPRDETLPEGIGHIVLQDPYSGRTMVVNPSSIKEAYERYVKQEEEMIRRSFISSGADFIHLSTGDSFVKPIIEFFMERRMRVWR